MRAPKEKSLAQLKTSIWIDALIRRAQVAGAFACVVERGDRDAGTVMVVVRADNSQTLYVPERDFEGQRVWRSRMVDEEGLRAALDSRRRFDPDLCVVEIEDRQGRHFIPEPVIEEPVIEDPAIEELNSGDIQTKAPAQEQDPAGPADALAAAKALFRDQ